MGRLKTSDFDYSLPREYIANDPLAVRDSSRLLVFDSGSGAVLHRSFADIVDFVSEGDVLVANRSKVIKARILFEGSGHAEKRPILRQLRRSLLAVQDRTATSQASCFLELHRFSACPKEIFLLKDLGENVWSCMVRPGKFFPAGKNFPINSSLSGEILEVLPDATRVIKFSDSPESFGVIPLPPYIKSSHADFNQYQTIYADEKGSVAAPTAGLHFTSDLIAVLKSKGVCFEKILLHVGRGTFLPVKTDFVDEHQMHAEYFDFSEPAASNLNKARRLGGKIFAVGTTSVRVLESCFENDCFVARKGETDIFFHPKGVASFKCVDALITNFHLPKSTLIMLVAAFLESKGVSDGREKILELYEIAKSKSYRFYSFGDAMLII